MLSQSFSYLGKRLRVEPPAEENSNGQVEDQSKLNLDYKAFQKRLETFQPLMWSSFNPVTPIDCARYVYIIK